MLPFIPKQTNRSFFDMMSKELREHSIVVKKHHVLGFDSSDKVIDLTHFTSGPISKNYDSPN